MSEYKASGAYYAPDMNDRPLFLGDVVTFNYRTERQLDEKSVTGRIKEVIFTLDGTALLRVIGRVTKPIDSRLVKKVEITDADAIVLRAFADHNVNVSLDEVRSMLNAISAFSQNDGQQTNAFVSDDMLGGEDDERG